ncbi:transmembrane protein 106A-like [Kogia breviceps]|uniref:transmembrane protein 106A-like n=1 Tax=Kogia breviceps TaxID=27615 RepID=UPI0034D2EFD1
MRPRETPRSRDTAVGGKDLNRRTVSFRACGKVAGIATRSPGENARGNVQLGGRGPKLKIRVRALRPEKTPSPLPRDTPLPAFMRSPTPAPPAPQPDRLGSARTAPLPSDSRALPAPLQNILSISNNNYYPIAVTQLTIEVLHLSLVVGQVSHSLLLRIGPLASEQMFYTVANRIWDENTYKICTWLKIKVHHVLLHIQGTLTCSYLSHSEQLVFQSYEYVDCRGNASKPHLLVPRPP